MVNLQHGIYESADCRAQYLGSGGTELGECSGDLGLVMVGSGGILCTLKLPSPTREGGICQNWKFDDDGGDDDDDVPSKQFVVLRRVLIHFRTQKGWSPQVIGGG